MSNQNLKFRNIAGHGAMPATESTQWTGFAARGPAGIRVAAASDSGVTTAAADETVLHSFNPYAQGAYPQANLYIGLDGKFYGTTSNGGTGGAGVVFKVDQGGHQSVLYNFTGGADGGGSFADVIQDWAGNLYGTTAYGGTGGVGVVFKVDPRGHETVLHSFTGGADGGYSYAGLIQDWAGNLYGTASSGGSAGAGVVFKIDPRGRYTVLYSFTGGADGAYPYGLIQDLAGNLYGTTSDGGADGAGVVFKLDRRGNETVLYSFTGGADGGYPNAGVIAGLVRQPVRNHQRRWRGRCWCRVQAG